MKTRRGLLAPLIGAMIATGMLLAVMPQTPAAHAAGTLTISRATVPQGAAVPISGSGFTGQDTLTVSLTAPVNGHSQNIQASTTTDANGSFVTRLNLPRAIAAGTYTVTARDSHGVSATSRLNVWTLFVLRVGGSSPSAIVVDRRGFFVDVLGFQSGESVRIEARFPTYSGNDVVESKTPTVDSHGNAWNVAMYAPADAKAGWATLAATGQTSNKQVGGRIYVAYYPFIWIKQKSIVAGGWFQVLGAGFVSDASVRISVTIQGGNGNSQTLSASATADRYGNINKWMRIPSYTSASTYSVTAQDLTGGFKRYAKLVVTAKPAPKPTAKPTPQPTAKPTATPTSTHASLIVLPAQTLPNQDVSLAGVSFPANASINVTTTVDLRGGGSRTIARTVYADSNGDFTATLRIPWKVAAGTYSVTASTSSSQASSRLQVLPLTAHPQNLQFQWVSLWYHTVRQGTWDYIDIQSTLHVQLGIWVHVIFPNGYHADYYAGTNNSGHWSVKFAIPRRAMSSHSNQAYITFQLWHGKQTTQSFMDFSLV